MDVIPLREELITYFCHLLPRNVSITYDEKDIDNLIKEHLQQQVSVEPEVIVQGELLPCPFCGEVPSIKYLPKPLPKELMIGYLRCCHTNITARGKRKKAIAEQISEHWNKRAGREPKSE